MESSQYRECREAMTRDPIVKALAEAMRPLDVATFRMPLGDPRWEFTHAALREYNKRAELFRRDFGAGADAVLYPRGAPRHIGAVAEAILLILDGKAPADVPMNECHIPALTASEAVAMGTRGELCYCPAHRQTTTIRVATMDWDAKAGWTVRLECGCALTDKAAE